jgi:hypothetical protein
MVKTQIGEMSKKMPWEILSPLISLIPGQDIC